MIFPRHDYLTQQLSGKTFGAIGTGGIGKAAVRIAQGFNMETVGYDVNRDDELVDDNSFQYIEQETVFQKADYIGLYAPAIPATKNTVDKQALTEMSDDAVLINTARAHLVDHEAVLRALNNGGLRGALVDVVDTSYEDKFFSHEKTMVTPHHAFYTEQALENMAVQAEEAVTALENKERPETAL